MMRGMFSGPRVAPRHGTLVLCLGLALAGTCGVQATDVCGPLTSDTSWTLSGSPYIVTCNVVVFLGAKLTIEPGVEVRFRPGTQLIVQDGTLVAVGTAEQPIRLHSDDPALPGSGLRARAGFGAAVLLEFCELSELDKAVQVTDGPGGDISIDRCDFAKNKYGITANGKTTTISSCQFSENGTGLDGFDALTRNTITGNEIGVVIKGPFTEFECNNIANNMLYNAVMDTDLSLAAPNNWWGLLEHSDIAQTIYDGANDSSLGFLVFWPYLPAPAAQAYTCSCSAGWVQLPVTGPTPRASHAMAYDSAREVVVLFGGTAPGMGYFNDTWEWNGTSWAKVASSGPSPRVQHALAYDSARGVTVLFGGATAIKLANDTWEWDGSTWTKVADTGPEARYGHALVFDERRGTILLGSGATSTGTDEKYLNGTWEWDGIVWTKIDPSKPPARRFYALTYDTARQVAALFGGDQGYYTYYSDIWEWDGASWASVSSGGPGKRTRHAMAYDIGKGVTMLFGGVIEYPSYIEYGDTWTWNGSTWTQLGDSGPSPRYWHAMAYGRGVALLFGGRTKLQKQLGDTWEYRSWPVPIITKQPSDLTVLAGQPAVFSVEVAESQLPLSYQWRKDAVPLSDGGHISGATTPTLTISPTAPADAGDYDVLVSLSCGGIGSDLATLTVSGAYAVGDLNCDGVINAFDIDPFVLALTDPAGYDAKYPDCERMLADINGDGKVDAFDIDPFVELLIGG